SGPCSRGRACRLRARAGAARRGRAAKRKAVASETELREGPPAMVDRGEMAAGSSACGCGAQHAAHGEGSARSGWVGALLAVLACALCPACLTTYAKLLSVLGMGVGLDAAAHERLLPAALVASIAI